MGALDHDGLLTLARKAQAAAFEADIERMGEDLELFVHALVGHLARERPELTRLPPAEARLLRRGQARLATTARTLLGDAEVGCAGTSDRCVARAEELPALLTLQTRDERLALHRPGARGGPERRWSS